MSKQPQFAFDGPLGKVLSKHFQRDAQNATLSLKFKLYYLLRPFIPIPLRQYLQRSRNSSLEIDNDWYIPNEFLAEFRTAVNSLDATTKVIHPWPDGHQFAISLTHDIETADGQKLVSGIASMEESLGLRSAWYFIPYKYKLDHGLIKDLKDRGHEIGIHGYNHDGKLFTSRAIFNYRTNYINKAGRELGSSGFRAPMVHRNLDWMQQLEFDYDASCFDIDPFQAMPGGVGGVWPFIVGRLVELPYTLPQDHTLLVTLGETSPRVWIRKLDLLAKLCGMGMLVTHPDYLDVPSRLSVYQEFCEHVAQQSNKWACLPSEISTWWRKRADSTIVENAGVYSINGPAASRSRIVDFSTLLADRR
jgi:peptidoglycan/xylan/chitin deacetylase (PgdA/CDA1 family)